MVKSVGGLKKGRLTKIIITVAVATLLALGGLFLYRGGYIFADTSTPESEPYAIYDLKDSLNIAYRNSGAQNYIEFAQEIVEGGGAVGMAGRTLANFDPLVLVIDSGVTTETTDDGRTFQESSYRQETLEQTAIEYYRIRDGFDDAAADAAANHYMNHYGTPQTRTLESAFQTLIDTYDGNTDKIEEALAEMLDDPSRAGGGEESDRPQYVDDILEPDNKRDSEAILADLAQADAQAAIDEAARRDAEELKKIMESDASFDEEAYERLIRGASSGSGSATSDGTGSSSGSGNATSDGSGDYNEEVAAEMRQRIATQLEGGYVAQLADLPTVRAKIVADGSNFVMNPIGQIEYRSAIKTMVRGTDGGLEYVDGYVSFNPFTGEYSGNINAAYAGRNIDLYTDPGTGDTYLSVSGKDGKAFADLGFVKVSRVIVGSNGNIGGRFEYQNRIFYYNPETKGFEIPLAIGGKKLVKPFAEAGEDSSQLGTLYLGTDGKIARGSINLDKTGRGKDLGSIYVDRNGTFGYVRDVKVGGSTVGVISINSQGKIDGSVNVVALASKAIGKDIPGGIGVYFGRDGFQGATATVGDLMRLVGSDSTSSFLSNVGIGVGKNGALSLSFAPLPGIGQLLSVGIGQNSSGNFELRWPGGKIGLFGNENRPLRAPELTESEDGGPDMSCIYFRHSFKKLFQTVRVYQVPCTKIEKEEQLDRGSMIFEVYHELLQRYPSMAELTHWYFYSGHQLYKFPQHEKDKAYRMEQTEKRLRDLITCRGDYARANEGMSNSKDVCSEYKWISAGKNPADAPTRPEEVFQSNVFEEGGSESGGEGSAADNESMQEFLDLLEELRRNDPGEELGDYYDQIEGIDPDTARANVDIGDTELDTTLLTRQGDYPVIEKLNDNTGLVLTLRKGFNEIFTPEEVGYINLIGVESDGIKVFEYDSSYSEDPNKSWNTNLKTMKPGTGYYLYNSGAEGRRIILRKTPTLGVGEDETVIKKGWNLLASSSTDTIKLGDYTAKTALQGWSGGCDIEGLCTKTLELRQIIKINKDNSRGYDTVYFLVPETDPLKIKKLISADVTESGRLNTIELKLGQMFWVYLYE